MKRKSNTTTRGSDERERIQFGKKNRRGRNFSRAEDHKDQKGDIEHLNWNPMQS